MDPRAAMMSDTGYNLVEIWQYPVTGSGMQRAPFGSGFGQFGDTNRDILANDPVGLEQKSGQVGGRRRRDADDEAANKIATTSDGNGNASIDGDGKRLKTSGGDEESNDSKAEAEPSSGKPVGKKAQPAEPPKDYIHVRARRGQATDSHSLAERARREKISERMKILQDLVPGCNKVIGKALVLDEIINYIQSLQRQVEFLSMKLEAVNSRMDPGIDVFPSKEGFQFVQQAFDSTGMAFGSQATREFSRGTSPEWLHMQLGGGFERTT